MRPYYEDEAVILYHGSMFEVLPALDATFDCCVADPPYGQTSLAWDLWPHGWPGLLTSYTSSLWCFGTTRMFLDRRDEFLEWQLSQDIVWDKSRPTTVVTDRFRRRHELVTHWYRGKWADVRHELPKVPSGIPIQRSASRSHITNEGERVYGFGAHQGWVDDGSRYMASVIEASPLSSVARRHGHAINATQKPEGILRPLIQYGCPPGGVVLDPFAGSGSTGIAARNLGRKAVLIELREEQCELTARRLSQQGFALEGIE